MSWDKIFDFLQQNLIFLCLRHYLFLFLALGLNQKCASPNHASTRDVHHT